MKRALWCAWVLLALVAGRSGAARADPAADATAVYAAFVAAQNAGDLVAVRALLREDPGFLWVTNGLSVWGVDAAIARLAGFHANPVWRIDPDRQRVRAVAVSADAAFVHVPLVLTVGSAADPQRYAILVSALCVATASGWRIAALFTTDENRGEGQAPAPDPR